MKLFPKTERIDNSITHRHSFQPAKCLRIIIQLNPVAVQQNLSVTDPVSLIIDDRNLPVLLKVRINDPLYQDHLLRGSLLFVNFLCRYPKHKRLFPEKFALQRRLLHP